MLGLNERQTALIRIHKQAATLATGDDPAAGAVAAVEVQSCEKGYSYYGLEPAGNAGGHLGGRTTC